MRNKSVRSCLQRSIEELKRDHRIPGFSKNLRQEGIRLGLEVGLGLFCDLWQRWEQNAAKSKSLTTSLQWTRYFEQFMGISPAELLSITCLMI
jgi:hypothetical protein